MLEVRELKNFFFAWRRRHEMVATIKSEVCDEYRIDNGGTDHDARVDEEAGDDRDAREYECDAGCQDAARRSIRTLEIGLPHAQRDVRRHHHHVGNGRSEDGDQDQKIALAAERQQEADDARNDERDVRRLAIVGQR